MKISMRGWLVVGACLAALTVLAAGSLDARGAEPPARGQLTDQSLGMLLEAMGLEATLQEKRYDFMYKTVVEDVEWEFSMSAVLSRDKQSIWIMAWLDELPRSAADVPRTALLRLLADNDKLGGGKAFAYVAANRRFVLQRVAPNAAITTAGFRTLLDDLGTSVAMTQPHWSVANWVNRSAPEKQATAPADPVRGSQPAPRIRPIQSATSDSRADTPTIRR